MKKIILIIIGVLAASCSQNGENKPIINKEINSDAKWDCDAIAAESHRWRFAGGKELNGLSNRRAAEVAPCYIQERGK